MNKTLIATAVAVALMRTASATEVLSFGQAVAGANPIMGTEANGVTTIVAVNAPISVTSCFGCGPLTTPQTFDMTAVSTGTAKTFDGFVIQGFKGTFSIMQGSTDILSGTFSDAIFGAGNSLVLSASDAVSGQSVKFTGGEPSILALFEPQAMSLSFADVQPIITLKDGSISTFASSVAGTFSASPVAAIPEPGMWGLLMMGLSGLGWNWWRRRK